jgi:hypothetical protein
MKTRPNILDLKLWNTLSIGVGAVIWLLALVFSLSDFSQQTQIKLLIFFGIALITPLALRILQTFKPIDGFLPLEEILFWLQPAAIVLSGLALISGQGWVGGILSLGWAIFTLLMALNGLLSLVVKYPFFPIQALCLNMGMMFVAISGFWFWGYHVSSRFLGFSNTIVLLTAAHFCYISLGALILAGMIAPYMQRFRRLFNITALILIGSPMLVALGITITAQTGSVSILESIGATFMGGSFLLISLLTLYTIPAVISDKRAQTLLLISAAAPILSMVMAIAYPIGNYTGWWTITISDMLMGHAWVNAIIVVGIGLIGWLLVPPLLGENNRS